MGINATGRDASLIGRGGVTRDTPGLGFAMARAIRNEHTSVTSTHHRATGTPVANPSGRALKKSRRAFGPAACKTRGDAGNTAEA